MFDITSSKLLILGVVALLVIGPKDLPALLRTLGKYMGMIRRHANEFRAQFEEAMRESELAELKQQVENVGTDAEASLRAAEHSVASEFEAATAGVDAAVASIDAKPAQDLQTVPPPDPHMDPHTDPQTDPHTDAAAHRADGLPETPSTVAAAGSPALNGTTHPHDGATQASTPAANQATRAAENHGA
jgi:sec-independent protein translocase protein TatB